MNRSYPKIALTLLLCLAGGVAWAGEAAKEAGNSVQSAAKSAVNEIGKGLEAVGKAVGPAVNKAEKAVRGDATAKDDKRPAERK